MKAVCERAGDWFSRRVGSVWDDGLWEFSSLQERERLVGAEYYQRDFEGEFQNFVLRRYRRHSHNIQSEVLNHLAE